MRTWKRPSSAVLLHPPRTLGMKRGSGSGCDSRRLSNWPVYLWLASNPPDVLATNLGLPPTVADGLP